MTHTAMKKRRRHGQPHHLHLLVSLLLLPLLLDCTCAALPSSPKMARIQQHLDRANKPALRTIQSMDGDTIDCVPRHKQHAMDHPLLRKHRIQSAPPRPMPASATATATFRASAAASGNATSRARAAWQTWHHAGHCPKGTVPVRRTTAEDVLRGGQSLFRFGRKRHRRDRAPRAANAPDVVTGNGHEVSPELYGDSRPRLFTYWTSDAYEATGCYNALCPGFVQTSSRVAIGAAISPVSSLAGEQYDMTLLIWKDPKLGNWWLSYGDAGASQLVGYWPAELFTHLSGHASMVEWGGEVVNTSPGGAHTATQMGSGRFAAEGFGRASYFRNLETVDAGNSLAPVSLDAVQTLAEDGGCYDIKKAYDERDGWGTHFYYGGPGHNPACP
uniref:Neprosin PEP catalytic domain-containing protein n=1 Tax=Triticum aestivum TaxID=4565 RepID=A0A3B6RMK8_WHEAT